MKTPSRWFTLTAFLVLAAASVMLAIHWSDAKELFVAMLCGGGGLSMAIVFPATNCSGRVINVSASTGCTLTRASIFGLTPEMYAANDLVELGMDKIYATLREARMAGYIENAWHTLLTSRITNMKGALTKQNIPGTQSQILPFISLRQRRNINWNYWKIASGTPTAGAGSGGVHPGSWDLVVQNNPGEFATTLVNLEQYFIAGHVLFVEYVTSANVSKSLQYKIKGAGTSGTTTTVTVEPNYTSAGWLALSAADKLVYQIGGLAGGNAQAGTLAMVGANSISDYESWGGQHNAENTNSLINFWPQRSRRVHEYTDEYLKALNDQLMSTYFDTFHQLPLAEQKRIQQLKYDMEMLNSCFYGQRISEKQTVEGYRNLERVVDPANPDCTLEFKANALGFKTQLNDCSRVNDLGGAAFNLDSFLNACRLIKRARMADGTYNMDEEPTIDSITDPVTAGMIRDVMIAFYIKKYGVVSQRFYQPEMTLKFENQVMFKYSTYQIPDELGGFVLAVFSSEIFRDRLSAASGSNRQRQIGVIDWSDIKLGILDTFTTTRRTNEADALYMYVQKINVKHVEMQSTLWCPIIEDANRHVWYDNFSTACPTITLSGCSIPQEA